MLGINVLTAKANIGDPVKNGDDQYLGEIADVLYDPESQIVEYAVVEYSEGEGRKSFAIPFGQLAFNGEEGFFLWDVQKEFLDRVDSRIDYQGYLYYVVN